MDWQIIFHASVIWIRAPVATQGWQLWQQCKHIPSAIASSYIAKIHQSGMYQISESDTTPYLYLQMHMCKARAKLLHRMHVLNWLSTSGCSQPIHRARRPWKVKACPSSPSCQRLYDGLEVLNAASLDWIPECLCSYRIDLWPCGTRNPSPGWMRPTPSALHGIAICSSASTLQQTEHICHMHDHTCKAIEAVTLHFGSVA